MRNKEIRVTYRVGDRIVWVNTMGNPQQGTVVGVNEITDQTRCPYLIIRPDGIGSGQVHLPVAWPLEGGGFVTPEAVHHPAGDKTGHPVSECASRGCNFPKPTHRQGRAKR